MARAWRARARAWSPGPLGTNDRTRAAPQIRTGAASVAVRPAPLAAAVGYRTSEVTHWQACGPVPAAKSATETDPPGSKVSAVLCVVPCTYVVSRFRPAWTAAVSGKILATWLAPPGLSSCSAGPTPGTHDRRAQLL